MSIGSKHSAGVVPLDEARRQRASAGDAENTAISEDELTTFSNAGEALKKARIALGFSLEHCSEQTNIPVQRLQALEAMDIAALPAAPFTLGFVRTYAGLLSLPVEVMVDRFQSEARYPERDFVPVINSRVKRDLGPPTQVSLMAVLIVIGVLSYVLWQVVQAISPDESIAAPERFPLAVGEQTAVPSETASSSQNTPSSEGAVATTAEAQDTTPMPSPANPRAVLTEIERLQASITAQVPMILVPGPPPRRVKPTLAEKRQFIIDQRAVRLAAQAEAAALLEAQVQAEAQDEALALQLEEDAARLAAEDAAIQAQAEPPLEGEGLLVDNQRANRANTPTLTPAAEPQQAPSVTEAPTAATITPPRRTQAIAAIYPVRCGNSASDEEVVTVSYMVSAAGSVINPTVTNSTNPCFNRSAMTALSKWKYTPAQSNGAAIDSNALSTRIVFRASSE